MSDVSRPYCCPEPRCTPIHNHGDGSDLSEPRPGQSFTCLGKMPREIEFTYDGHDHRNDLNRCVYTPLKGILRYQENIEDWRLEQVVLKVGLHRLGVHDGEGNLPPKVSPPMSPALHRATSEDAADSAKVSSESVPEERA